MAKPPMPITIPSHCKMEWCVSARDEAENALLLGIKANAERQQAAFNESRPFVDDIVTNLIRDGRHVKANRVLAAQIALHVAAEDLTQSLLAAMGIP